MRTLVHLSDLHFDHVDPAIVEAIVESIGRINPHVVAVSGDLTQRARRRQFLQARAFLDSLPYPRVVVPGNHDVPLFNVVARFAAPLGGYRRYITGNLRPFHLDEEIVVLGTNTTRSFTIKDGGIRQADVDWICDRLQNVRKPVVKILVSHHPFEPSDDREGGAGSSFADGAAGTLSRGGVDVFLTGHLHVSYTGHTAARYNIGGRPAIVVEAGTATSTRLRGEANAFNVLHIDPMAIIVERFEWQPPQGFVGVDTQRFDRSPAGWALR